MADVAPLPAMTRPHRVHVLSGNKPSAPRRATPSWRPCASWATQMNVTARGLRTGRTGPPDRGRARPAHRLLRRAGARRGRRGRAARVGGDPPADPVRPRAGAGDPRRARRLSATAWTSSPTRWARPTATCWSATSRWVLLADHPLPRTPTKLVLDNVAIGRAATAHLLAGGGAAWRWSAEPRPRFSAPPAPTGSRATRRPSRERACPCDPSSWWGRAVDVDGGVQAAEELLASAPVRRQVLRQRLPGAGGAARAAAPRRRRAR